MTGKMHLRQGRRGKLGIECPIIKRCRPVDVSHGKDLHEQYIKALSYLCSFTGTFNFDVVTRFGKYPYIVSGFSAGSQLCNTFYRCLFGFLKS